MSPTVQQVQQIAVESLLDSRPVTTLSNGALSTWTTGIDLDDGYITHAAAVFLKQSGEALPDDARFVGTEQHPEMVLHFSNEASPSSSQARVVSGLGSFELVVPPARYSAVYLALTSSYGDCSLAITLHYAGSDSSHSSFALPDWGTGKPLPTEPPIFFNLVQGLHKWTRSNAQVDTPSHTVTGVKIATDSSKSLGSLTIDKQDAKSRLVFWGATGVVESEPESGGSAGSSGSSGSAGSAGSAQAGTGGAAAGAPSGGVETGGAVAVAGSTPAAAGAATSAGAANTPRDNANANDSPSCAMSSRRSTHGLLLALLLLALGRRLSSR